MDEISDAEIFFGPDGARLAPLYAAGRFVFCWPGLLFPQAWFLYRKMYVWAALVSAGPLLLAFVPQYLLLSWLTSIAGALGLRFYFAQADNTIARIRALDLDEAETRRLLAQAGGVSRIGAAVGLVFAFSAFVLSLRAGAHLAPPLK